LGVEVGAEVVLVADQGLAWAFGQESGFGGEDVGLDSSAAVFGLATADVRLA
jgi:hypothetical protein